MKFTKMPLSILQTQVAIKQIKTIFEENLSIRLHLLRVSAPRFIRTNTGIQDDLALTCKSVSFFVPSCNYDVEMVHSLAKWKRIALGKYGIGYHNGIYTDMDAIRKDERLDNMHSVYVDQWDWEMVITPEDRTEVFLCNIISKIYFSIRKVEEYLWLKYGIWKCLPSELHYIHTEELVTMYPNLTPKERENAITQRYGAVFLMGIGGVLQDGQVHDVRAMDYDDWSTPNGEFKGLNGDLLVWSDVLKCAFEISSMGIRVDANALRVQSDITRQPIDTLYHQMVLDDKVPLSIGGGIGQSRLCMYLLKKRHIGEVQASEWPEQMVDDCRRQGIHLL